MQWLGAHLSREGKRVSYYSLENPAKVDRVKYTSPVTAYVSGVQDSLGLTWLPDASTGRDRYTFAVYATMHG